MSEALVAAATIEDTPMFFTRYALLEAEAMNKADALRTRAARIGEQIKEVEAKAYIDIYDRPGQKPPTGDAIQAAIRVNPARLALVDQRREAELTLLTVDAEIRILSVMVKALLMKSAHLVAMVAGGAPVGINRKEHMPA